MSVCVSGWDEQPQCGASCNNGVCAGAVGEEKPDDPIGSPAEGSGNNTRPLISLISLFFYSITSEHMPAAFSCYKKISPDEITHS